jgi:hypothetical protein
MHKRAACLLCCLAILGTAGTALGELVGHWKLDDGSGMKAVDSSGKGNDGTLKGNPTWVTGTKDGALEFRGTGFARVSWTTARPHGPPGHHGPDLPRPLDRPTRDRRKAPAVAKWPDSESGSGRQSRLELPGSIAGAVRPFAGVTFNTTPGLGLRRQETG